MSCNVTGGFWALLIWFQSRFLSLLLPPKNGAKRLKIGDPNEGREGPWFFCVDPNSEPGWGMMILQGFWRRLHSMFLCFLCVCVCFSFNLFVFQPIFLAVDGFKMAGVLFLCIFYRNQNPFFEVIIKPTTNHTFPPSNHLAVSLPGVLWRQGKQLFHRSKRNGWRWGPWSGRFGFGFHGNLRYPPPPKATPPKK